MLYVISLEKIDKRYTGQWYEWFDRELKRQKIDYKFINGTQNNSNKYMKIVDGRFLDIIQTNIWKSQQVINIAKLVQNKEIKDTDKFLFMDGWHPGIINLKYMLDLKEIKAKIYSIWHAGCYDKFDFISQAGMGKWAHGAEYSMMKACDKIFVATNFHKNLINQQYEDIKKIYVTGLPFYLKEINNGKKIRKENIIVFPHRVDKEKQPDIFDKLAKELPQYEFIKTIEVTKTKKEYYKILAKAKIIFSANLQETWGIGTIEGLAFDCSPYVPNRLSYTEMYDKNFIYNKNNLKNMKEDLVYLIENYGKMSLLRKKNLDKLDNIYKNSISNMLELMEEKRNGKERINWEK